MKHFYQNIDGYFDFQEIYKEMVNKNNHNSLFVEVRSWYGCSTAFMAVEIINSKKNMKIYAVDTWEGAGGLLSDENLAKHGNIFEFFKSNLSSVIEYINPMKMTSIEAAKKFENSSLDFVFIDANHDYDFIKEDIEVWYPKVRSGGYIGGHDYSTTYPGVIRAVDEFFTNKENLDIIRTSWLFFKQNKTLSKSIGKKINREIRIHKLKTLLRQNLVKLIPNPIKRILKKITRK
ncbi:MAG: class I SAM-dependent methyltransferase [Bacteroidia bacterium]|nr:class I SAM-dependent methyltransferase [Bacteroidia bacterium]